MTILLRQLLLKIDKLKAWKQKFSEEFLLQAIIVDSSSDFQIAHVPEAQLAEYFSDSYQSVERFPLECSLRVLD